jgi:hypothetical protein
VLPMATLFFSYSHRDEVIRDELEVHLSMLKRQGIIDAWHDRRLLPGDNWDGVISEYLERAEIVLLLVSSYFLDSHYCYDIELARAMEKHAAGEVRVLPVIIDPCDWHHAPFGKLQAVPKDGKPISKFPNQHDAFLEVVHAVRAAAERTKVGSTQGRSITPVVNAKKKLIPTTAQVRSSNLRIKKAFTDDDRDTFLDATFEYISKFFEGSLAELTNETRASQPNFAESTQIISPQLSISAGRASANAAYGLAVRRWRTKYYSHMTRIRRTAGTNRLGSGMTVTSCS